MQLVENHFDDLFIREKNLKLLFNNDEIYQLIKYLVYSSILKSDAPVYSSTNKDIYINCFRKYIVM